MRLATFTVTLVAVTMVAGSDLSGQQPGPKRVDAADVIDSFSEDSSRVLVFAGLAISESGGIALDPEHFLLGLIQQSPTTIARFALPEWPVTRLQEEVSKALKDYPKPPEGSEFSLSDRTNRLLVSAWEVALEAGSASIRPEDLLRALTSDRGPAGNLLRQAGITPEKLASSLGKQSK